MVAVLNCFVAKPGMTKPGTGTNPFGILQAYSSHGQSTEGILALRLQKESH